MSRMILTTVILLLLRPDEIEKTSGKHAPHFIGKAAAGIRHVDCLLADSGANSFKNRLQNKQKCDHLRNSDNALNDVNIDQETVTMSMQCEC